MKIASTDQAGIVPTTPMINCIYLKQNKILTVILIICFIITGGLFYLPFHWFIKLKTLFYLKSNGEESTHVLVSRKDCPIKICKVRDCNVYQNASNSELPQEEKKFRIIEFNHELFSYNPEIGVYVPLYFNTNLQFTKFHELSGGISSMKLIKNRKRLFGEAVIEVPVPSWLELYATEILAPFFVFQIFSIIVWCNEQYYWYSICIFVIMAVTLIVNVRYQRIYLVGIRDLATYVCDVDLLRMSERETVKSNEMVPGDVMFIRDGLILPCDVVLLKGYALMDEIMLTGESQPVLKESMPEISNSRYNKDKLYTLSAGTKVVTAGGNGEEEPIGIVISTGFSTAKGELVRSILYPRPNRFKFLRDALLFVAMMFVMALIGFFVSIPPLETGSYAPTDWVIKLLDLVTIAVPPALPLTMSIGIGYSLGRLKKNKISCISQPAINASGRVTVICFDKTGTLTTDFMKLKGVYDCSQDSAVEDFSKLSINLQKCLSVCHSLTLHKDNFLGDPQEIAMLEAVGWKCELLDNGKLLVKSPDESCCISSRFTYHFNPEIKRMGVIVVEGEEIYLLMKGAPEVILPLCKGVPNEIYGVLIHLTRMGYRVLACGYKKLNYFDPNDPLEDVEKGLTLIGMPYLENPLKSDTVDTINTLLKARIQCVISTGDNLLTALSVGKAINLVISKEVYLGDYLGGEIVWEDGDGKRVEKLPEKSDFEVIISGNLLEKILLESSEYFEVVRNKCRVFGRMAPKHKIMLVSSFQQGETMVAMVGDGANDCGALKQADVGLSLSEAEASIAAPFSSKEISSIIYVLREGRCALATSYQSFKFMCMYSVIQFTCAVVLYWKQTNLTNNQYIYQDFFNVMPMVFTVAASSPYHKLSKKLPPGSLMSFPIVVSVIGVVFLAVGLIISPVLLLKPCFSWYTEEGDPGNPYNITDPGYIGDLEPDSTGQVAKSTTVWPLATLIGNVVFLQGTLQLIVDCTVFSMGKPFREPIYKNYAYMICLTILMAFNMYFIFGRGTFPFYFVDIWGDNHMDYRWMVFGIFWTGSLITYLYEKFAVAFIVKCIRMCQGRT